MEDKQLNSTESLELIQRMITQTRTNMEQGSGTIFLIWGYTTILVAIVTNLLVYYTQNPYFFWGWFANPVIGWSAMNLYLRKREKPVRTFVDRVISITWVVIGIAAALVPLMQFIKSSTGAFVIPTEALILSIGVLITGAVIRFTQLIVGGGISMILSFVLYTTNLTYINVTIVFMAMFIVSMIIPGHILNYRGKRCSKS